MGAGRIWAEVEPDRERRCDSPPGDTSSHPCNTYRALSATRENKAIEGTDQDRDEHQPCSEDDDRGSGCDDVDHNCDCNRGDHDWDCPGSQPKNDHPYLPVKCLTRKEIPNRTLHKSAAVGSTDDMDP